VKLINLSLKINQKNVSRNHAIAAEQVPRPLRT
jgi:hypothetical protein